MFEKVVYDQAEAYLDQKSFCTNFSLVLEVSFPLKHDCLIHLTDFIKFQMDNGHYVGMFLLDLQRAFDTVDHNILLMKVEAIGLNQDVVRWFRSYLADLQQLVDVSGTLSSSAEIKYGVPQGLSWDPFYF